ncbi:hypothetical protein QEJ31_08610 [Pigmentibacter sp. JX0631]|uniref:hypothetical protein n=1 Tax=Pigmentibacter sp. JX0631 TaxID=2976982 RepID=UPI002468550B|nr:hypothetical protein [Pigmentibacter sp. JX0631]WGL58596.1 hypothetical protein QEJ31_08610 [Pigmentibacter sp. JX0631]
MLRRYLLVSCLSLSSIALYSCKNSDNKSAPTSTTASKKKIAKNLSLSFDTFIGNKYSYALSGEKKCETDFNSTSFTDVNDVNINEGENCEIIVKSLSAKGKEDNKIVIFTPKEANKNLVISINKEGKLTSIYPVVFKANDPNIPEHYLGANLSNDNLNLILNSLTYIEAKLIAEKVELLTSIPDAPSEERKLDISFSFVKGTLPENLINLEKKAKFNRKFALDKYELLENSLELKIILNEQADATKCKITTEDISSLTNDSISSLPSCNSTLEFNKKYTILYSEEGTWDLNKVKIGYILPVSNEILAEDFPKVLPETVREELNRLNNKFKDVLDAYTNKYISKLSLLNKENDQDKIASLKAQLKAYYKKLNEIYKDRSDKDYVPQGFELKNNEIEQVEDKTVEQPQQPQQPNSNTVADGSSDSDLNNIDLPKVPDQNNNPSTEETIIEENTQEENNVDSDENTNLPKDADELDNNAEESTTKEDEANS